MAVPKLIYCAAGGKRFAQIAVEQGWLYGARLPGAVSQPVYFADQDWKAPDRCAYMRALAKHKPTMATVLDWEQVDQLAEVLSWAEEAAQYVQQVVIIPKVFSGLGRLPRRIGKAEVVLGYSVPTSYGGSRLGAWEIGKRWPVHLLGGSPHKQRQTARYLHVVSCDGNMTAQQARKGRFWRYRRGAKGHWVQLSEIGDLRSKDASYECFRLSLQNVQQAWRLWSRV